MQDNKAGALENNYGYDLSLSEQDCLQCAVQPTKKVLDRTDRGYLKIY